MGWHPCCCNVCCGFCQGELQTDDPGVIVYATLKGMATDEGFTNTPLDCGDFDITDGTDLNDREVSLGTTTCVLPEASCIFTLMEQFVRGLDADDTVFPASGTPSSTPPIRPAWGCVSTSGGMFTCVKTVGFDTSSIQVSGDIYLMRTKKGRRLMGADIAKIEVDVKTAPHLIPYTANSAYGFISLGTGKQECDGLTVEIPLTEQPEDVDAGSVFDTSNPATAPHGTVSCNDPAGHPIEMFTLPTSVVVRLEAVP